MSEMKREVRVLVDSNDDRLDVLVAVAFPPSPSCATANVGPVKEWVRGRLDEKAIIKSDNETPNRCIIERDRFISSAARSFLPYLPSIDFSN